MPQAATQDQDKAEAPVAHRLTRGLRAGEIRTRAAVNGAPASGTFDAEARTFEFTLLTSRSCNSYRYVLTDGDRWPAYTRVEEKLDMAGAVGLVELVGSSVLNSHRYWDIESVIGVIESAEVEGEALNCRARLSRRPDVEPIAQDIADGILRSMSGGFDIIEETLTVRENQDPLVTITKWRPREASVVPVPADPSARIRSGEPYVPQAKIVPPPAGQRSEAEPEAAAVVTAPVLPAATETVEAATAEVEAARSALAKAEATLASRAAAAPKAPVTGADAERTAHVAALREVARGRGEKVSKEFEALAGTGATVAELRSVCVAAIATTGGEIFGAAAPVSGGRAEAPLLTRNAYAAHRAAAAN
ncbi:HK97 family phage prohead protease [Methylobacterium iners]|uniref:Prohead serine protease domain-containing protein n=1 Tax=Methylobacterium iners TaxID=418707 RepID=A0ABQ4S3K3_9HYPH|nr:HK97 family phage prohead protease [Methylobacterium iners]GJD97471.1 hypothetical protein OCOJLMKI_4702 [Methylobacterium iners]